MSTPEQKIRLAQQKAARLKPTRNMRLADSWAAEFWKLNRRDNRRLVILVSLLSAILAVQVVMFL